MSEFLAHFSLYQILVLSVGIWFTLSFLLLSVLVLVTMSRLNSLIDSTRDLTSRMAQTEQVQNSLWIRIATIQQVVIDIRDDQRRQIRGSGNQRHVA